MVREPTLGEDNGTIIHEGEKYILQSDQEPLSNVGAFPQLFGVLEMIVSSCQCQMEINNSRVTFSPDIVFIKRALYTDVNWYNNSRCDSHTRTK